MEYNLKSIKKQFSERGVFYTPHKLALLLKSYTQSSVKEVYDPTCGDGGLLSVFDDNVKKYGQEIDSVQLEIAKQRLVNFEGEEGDTLKSPAWFNKRFDCIVANYPFSIKWEPPKPLFADERFVVAPCLPPPSKADYAFILHILHMLSDNGEAICLCSPGILYRGGKEKIIRRWLVEKGYIKKIVHIAKDTFVDTSIATVILIFSKKPNKLNTIEIIDTVLNQEKVVTLSEIASNDFNLSPSTYIQKKIFKEVIDPLDLQLKARQQMINALRKDLRLDLVVCNIEGWSQETFLHDLKQVIDEFCSG